MLRFGQTLNHFGIQKSCVTVSNGKRNTIYIYAFVCSSIQINMMTLSKIHSFCFQVSKSKKKHENLENYYFFCKCSHNLFTNTYHILMQAVFSILTKKSKDYFYEFHFIILSSYFYFLNQTA